MTSDQDVGELLDAGGAAEAVATPPDDAIALDVLRVITEIQSGARPQPSTLEELEASF